VNFGGNSCGNRRACQARADDKHRILPSDLGVDGRIVIVALYQIATVDVRVVFPRVDGRIVIVALC
jgi:hypothetical protein